MVVMKLLLIPFILLSFNFYGNSQVHAATPPPPPPPKSKSEASHRDIRIIKEQSQEIQNLKAEILALKVRIEKLQTERSGNKDNSQASQKQKSFNSEAQKKVAHTTLAVKKASIVSKEKTTTKKDFSKKAHPAVENKISTKKKQIVTKNKKTRKPTAVAFKSGLNKFVKNCSMFAKPNASSAKVGSVSAGKKLWIDKHNSEWRKAYKKSGTVYVHKDCF